MSFVVKEEEVGWKPHPIARGAEIKHLVTKREHKSDVTCMLVIVRKGVVIPEHTHAEQDDIIYPLSGRAKMWVDGIGEFELKRGVLVRVLKGTKHKVYDVTEDLLVYDVFSPATV